MWTQSLTPGQQHGLVAQRDPGAAQHVAGARELGRDLVGVVDVDVHPQRVVLGEHLAELLVDPLRQEHRHARADPDDLDVRDLAQAADRRLEELRGERQAVAARDQHVADLRRPADVVELRLVLAAVEVLGRVADDPAPRAVPAVARALRRDQHQDAIGVAVDEPRDGRVPVLGEAVLHHPGEAAQLAAERDDLAPDRVLGILGVDEADEVGRDVDAELVGGGQALALLVGQLQDLLDLGELVDAVRELPLPVVPLLVGNVLPHRGAAADRRLPVGAELPRGVALVDERRLVHRRQRTRFGLHPRLRLHPGPPTCSVTRIGTWPPNA